MAVSRYTRLLREYRRKTLYATPQDFLEAAIEYFEWCENNPVQEEKVHVHNVDKEVVITRTNTDKCRAFTKSGLAQFLGMPAGRLDSYKTRVDPAWGEIVGLIEEAIWTQKFEHAAAGLLNSNIIIRDLGLSEKKEVKTEEKEVAQVDTRRLANVIHPDATAEQLDLIYSAGREPPMYTPEQIEAGVPWVMPANV